ncbi:hypothetical protein JKF63_02523 [Porcisia hertigi]|uniref:Uncharacterized protein n=1 Tax=Porcisia hertigi TaxID=2761500 RepID=A0A836L3W2_9TRYP|nr:hypothetical protein JKF63_02523 [Porcisia hertigi]
MTALKEINASAEITPLLACGSDYVKKGTQTLCIRSVYATLDALERLWKIHREQSHLSDSGRAQGLRHYHAVYEASARCVPLSPARWEQWLAGLSGQNPPSTMRPASDVPIVTASVRLHNIQTEAIDSYWHLYRRLCWGSSGAAKAGLATVMEQADGAVSVLPSMVARDTAPSLTELEEALAKPLQEFARLSAESAHLFAHYPLIGRVERIWLSETVAPALGSSTEAVVEALVRRTFKRDLRVPSVALPDLLREYEETEVNEQKVKDILAVGQATLRSSWMESASALHAHMAELTEGKNAPEASGKPGMRSPVHSTRLQELRDALLSVLVKVPNDQGCLPALGLLVQGLLEDHDETSASTEPCRSLNGSQTHFYLHLLHRWFSTYVRSHHRWSVTEMFAAPDDADLWMFLLDRHAVCLTWALATEHPTLEDAAACTRAETQLEYLHRLAISVDKLRAILYSVVHCVQLYRVSVTEFTKTEKREVRLKTAATATQLWMKQIGVETFCRALLNDVLDATAQWEDAQGGYDAEVQQCALLVEVELKLVMYDTMMMLQCAEKSTERLETLVEDALELSDAWRAAKEQTCAPARPEYNDLAIPVVGVVGRCIHRISLHLRKELAAASSVTEAHANLYRKVVQWLKRGIRAMAFFGGDPSSLWDEWTSLVAIPVDSTKQLYSDEFADGAHPRPLLGYTVPPPTGSRAPRQSATAGGLDDLCWERRSVAKVFRKGSATCISEGVSGDHHVTSPLDTRQCGDEESGIRQLKKARLD